MRYLFLCLNCIVILFLFGESRAQSNFSPIHTLVDDKVYAYLKVQEIPTIKQQEQLNTLPVSLLGFKAPDQYLVSFPSSVSIQDIHSIVIGSVLVPLSAEGKLSSNLIAGEVPSYALHSPHEWILLVSGMPDISVNTLKSSLETIETLAIEELDELAKVARVHVHKNQLGKVSALASVYFIEFVSPPAEPENLPGKTLHRSNYINKLSENGAPINGSGVVVALGDDGIIGPHADYQGRVNQSNVVVNNGDHGDHIAGTIMGAGNINPARVGMAPGASLMVYQVWNAVNSSPSSYSTSGVRITSTSYGDGCNTGYTSFARTADIHIVQNPALMHVFSAGNSGTSNCGYGAGSGWGNITGGVKAAKNVLAVGNLSDIDALNSSSSRGPVHDGRLKPDICAMGTSVVSTVDIHTYSTKTGTSMAAPGISGVMAQLYQGYRLLNNGQDPTSALIKAAMMNTADDLGNVGPDFRHGYGRVNARRAYELIKNNRFQSGSIAQGQIQDITINVPAGMVEFRAMLYWNDREALAGASRALVNNLDFEVITPANTTLLPWVLNSSPNTNALNSLAVRGIDSLNNTEQVTFTVPSAGVYTLRIKGTSIPLGSQNYVVVYEFRDQDVTLTYPAGGESLEPGTMTTIRFDAAPGSFGVTTIQYSINNGQTWSTIASAVSTSARHFNWLIPQSLEGKKAVIRIRRGSTGEDISTPVHFMKTPTGLNIQWVCNNNLRMRWPRVPQATGYIVYALGAQFMDSIGFTNDTSFIVQGIASSAETFLSVRAIGAGGVQSERAIALRKLGSGTIGCIPPTASFQSPDSICISDSQQFLDQSMGAGSSFSWSFGPNATPASAIGRGPHNVIFQTSGSQQIRLTVSNDLGIDSITKSVVVRESPSAQFTMIPTGTPRTFQFVPDSLNYFAYLWNLGDGTTASNSTPIYTYATDSTYLVSLNVSDGRCASSNSTLLVVNSTISGLGIENALPVSVSLAPNPAQSFVVLEVANAEVQSVTLWDTKGAMYATELVKMDAFEQVKWKMMLEGFSNGLYLVRIQTDKGIFTRKLVLE